MHRAFGLCVGICLLAGVAIAAEPLVLDEGDRQRVDKAIEALTPQLALDAGQADALRPLLAEHYADLREARDAYSKWPAEEGQPAFLAERTRLRDVLHQKLGAVLDTDQLLRFKQLQARNVNHAAAAREPE